MNDDLFLIKLGEIKKALHFELYNCALVLALTLPDVCSKAEYPEECSSKKRYLNWFKHYGESYFTVPICKTLCQGAEDYYLNKKEDFNLSEIKILTW